MKKGAITLAGLLVLFSISLVYAMGCDLDVSMINQDPYPAVPGDYVKIVFQIDGIEASTCGDVTFELLEQYPLKFDPDMNPLVSIKAGTHIKDYESFAMIPYRVRIDENALDGDNPVEVGYTYSKEGTGAVESEQFDLNVEDTRADFEIFIKNYDYLSSEITFEILNTGKSDIEALTLELLDQENIQVKGSNRNIVGDLDSNDYTTADFEVIPSNGEITMKILYTDSINVRRNIEKTVQFDSKYFLDRNGEGEKTSVWTYIIIVVVVVAVIYWFYKRKKKKQAQHRHKH
jgi:hypothetical protein